MYSLKEAHRAMREVGLIEGLPPKELCTRLEIGNRLGDSGQGMLAFFLADMQSRGADALVGQPSAAEYAENQLDMDRRRAGELIRVGGRLRELPFVWQAFCEQRIGWSMFGGRLGWGSGRSGAIRADIVARGRVSSPRGMPRRAHASEMGLESVPARPWRRSSGARSRGELDTMPYASGAIRRSRRAPSRCWSRCGSSGASGAAFAPTLQPSKPRAGWTCREPDFV